jgi:hypothetical protein
MFYEPGESFYYFHDEWRVHLRRRKCDALVSYCHWPSMFTNHKGLSYIVPDITDKISKWTDRIQSSSETNTAMSVLVFPFIMCVFLVTIYIMGLYLLSW